MRLTDRLGDHCFVLATEALHTIAAAFEAETGHRPSLAELCEILTAGARGCSEPLIKDGLNRAITITGRLQRRTKPVAVSRGDIISVPLESARSCLVVCLGKFATFGTAFGVVGNYARQIPEGWVPRPASRHGVFVDPEMVRSGEWPIVGHRADLAEAFGDPELFHHPRNDPGDGSYGPHGLAEAASGKLRRLDAQEATAIFGEARRYQQSYSCDAFVQYLTEVLAEDTRGT